jgi:hypothetical protein
MPGFQDGILRPAIGVLLAPLDAIRVARAVVVSAHADGIAGDDQIVGGAAVHVMELIGPHVPHVKPVHQGRRRCPNHPNSCSTRERSGFCWRPRGAVKIAAHNKLMRSATSTCRSRALLAHLGWRSIRSMVSFSICSYRIKAMTCGFCMKRIRISETSNMKNAGTAIAIPDASQAERLDRVRAHGVRPVPRQCVSTRDSLNVCIHAPGGAITNRSRIRVCATGRARPNGQVLIPF